MVDNSFLDDQLKVIESYRLEITEKNEGKVTAIGDGVAWLKGLPLAAMDEEIIFEDGSKGLVFFIGKDLIGAILLSQTEHLTAGTTVYRGFESVSIPVGDALLGRVVDPLGSPLDGLSPAECHQSLKIDVKSPPIVKRTFVTKPLYTGTRVIDTMIPIGKGQRQLIIGDNGLGKTSLCIDAVINQKEHNVKCVYVLIGQKRSQVASIIDTLKRFDAFEHTVVVVAEATALPGLQFLAPFAGCTIADHWMWNGEDTLVIYDDLTTHARTYRELSLLLKRPPGREAYPGDIFYLHSRLLERSTALAAKYGGGTMTALPIVETEQGEIAAFIPTNLISITDGQIYLDHKLFVGGYLPAIDVTRSVSRIGGKAQHHRIKEEVGRTKLDYLQYHELEVFTRFGAKLEAATERIIKRGRLLKRLFKQDLYCPLTPIEELVWLIAFNEHLLDDLEDKDNEHFFNRVKSVVARSGLSIDSSRQSWLEHLRMEFKVTSNG